MKYQTKQLQLESLSKSKEENGTQNLRGEIFIGFFLKKKKIDFSVAAHTGLPTATYNNQRKIPACAAYSSYLSHYWITKQDLVKRMQGLQRIGGGAVPKDIWMPDH